MSRAARVRARRPAPPDLAGALARVSLETRALLAILAGGLLLRLLALYAFSTEYDEGVYWLTLRGMARGQPLYSALYHAQPPFFLLSLYPFFAAFGQTLPAARLVVALYSLLGVAALYRIGARLAGPGVGLLAAALLAADPLYLRVSRALQAEAPAVAFSLVGIALALEAAHRAGRPRRLLALAGGAALGLAIMTKLFAVVALVPAALLLAPLPASFALRRGWPRVRMRAGARPMAEDVALLLAGVLVACLAVLAPFLGDLPAVFDQVVGLHLAAARAMGGGLPGNLAVLGATGSEYWLLAAALAALALLIWRRAWNTRSMLAVLAWAGASLLFLLAQRPLFAHHVALLVPPLALLAGLVVRLAPPMRAGRRRPAAHGRRGATLRALARPTILTYGALILAGSALVVALVIGVVESQRAADYPAADRLQVVLALGALTLPGDAVAADDQYLVGLADRATPPALVDTSSVRIASGGLTADMLEREITRSDTRVVLFASGRFDAIPGFRAWVEANFVEYKPPRPFGGGRALYLKRPPGPVAA